MQGLSVPFACVGSGDPVRVLRLYTTNTLDVLLKHLLLRRMYNLPLPILLCYAQALRSETSYCYCDRVTPSACVQVTLCECRVRIPRTVLCGALYTACVDTSRTVFWDRSFTLARGRIVEYCKTRRLHTINQTETNYSKKALSKK